MRRTAILIVFAALLTATSVQAESIGSADSLLVPSRPAHDPWQVSWVPAPQASVNPQAPVARALSSVIPLEYVASPGQGDQPTHAVAVEYSDAYQLRRKIHKYASFATLPLFAAELALGQSLYNPPSTTNGTTTVYQESGSKKAAHAFVGASIVGLFAVNTVTGAWNMFGEGWSDTNGRTIRLVHGLLMMAADVGFLATTASAPNSGGRNGALNFTTNEATHRNIAVASISVATAGYLLMLLGNH